MTRPPLFNYDRKRAINAVLDEELPGNPDCRLGDLTRKVERRLQEAAPLLAQGITTRMVADRLRMRGYRRIGWHGHGYDREPVYSCSLPRTPPAGAMMGAVAQQGDIND